MLRLLIDKNIPLAKEAFSDFGEARLASGRAITHSMLRNIDALIVRSVTPVNAALLDNTPVRFVGTTTIGVDHVDLDYLRDRNIGFADAAGGNANSVAEYVVAALLHHACEKKLHLGDLTIGVVGVGNVGRRVVRYAEALGLRVLQNDPPRQRAEKADDFVSLDEIMQADIISLHTPLTMAGDDATLHLFGATRLAQINHGALLVNTARGGVIDTAALKDCLSRQRLTAYLDVWENEPEIDGELLNQVGLGTSHIAGYSYDGKVNGTRLIYQALCKFLERKARWQPAELPQPAQPLIRVQPQATLEQSLHLIIRSAYDVIADGDRLKLAATYSRRERGKHFDALRANYPLRREFSSYAVDADHLTDELIRELRALGFQIRMD
jgi:erythronate-4-phosphate dehydrogenase